MPHAQLPVKKENIVFYFSPLTHAKLLRQLWGKGCYDYILNKLDAAFCWGIYECIFQIAPAVQAVISSIKKIHDISSVYGTGSKCKYLSYWFFFFYSKKGLKIYTIHSSREKKLLMKEITLSLSLFKKIMLYHLKTTTNKQKWWFCLPSGGVLMGGLRQYMW